MPLQIVTKAVGSHSTSVEVEFFTKLVGEALKEVESNNVVELNIRRVHVRKYERDPGVYATGYNVEIPHSVELLLFDNAPTGRPATLALKNNELLGEVLANLSPRLFDSWSQIGVRNFNVDITSVSANAEKLGRHAIKEGSQSKMVRSLVSAVRSWLKADLGRTAYTLLAKEHEHQGLTAQMVSSIWRTEPLQPSELIEPLLHQFEQFGLIVLDKAYGVTIVRLTDHCVDLARQRAEEENEKRQQKWLSDQRAIQNELDRAIRRVDEAKRLLNSRESEVEKIKAKLEELAAATPELVQILE